jgi:hypothetical protein
MTNPAAIFAGRRSLLLTPDGLIRKDGSISDFEGTLNLIPNGHFEISTVGWAAYKEGVASTAPTSGATGGSPSITFTRSTSQTIMGQASGLISKDAVNRQGEGVSYEADVPVATNNQPLLISFDYKTSANYVGSGAEYINVYIYDVTNAGLITPSVIQLPAALNGGTFQTAFQCPQTSSIRLAFHIAGTGTDAWTMAVDNILVGKIYSPLSAGGYTVLTSANGLLLQDGSIINNNGDINPIHNGHFEQSTAGWATYADTPGPTPIDGTGGSPLITLTRETSSPLSGDADGLITKDAINRQGEGVSYDFEIPAGFQAQQLTINLLADASGGYTGGGTEQVSVYIYDITNANLITPSNVAIDTSGRFQASFTAAANSVNYRLILHIATTGTVAWTMKIDEIRVILADVTGGLTVTTNGVQNVSNKIFSNSYIIGESGEANYVSNPSAQTDLSGWASSGAGVTVTRTTTSAELPRASLRATGIKITPVSGTVDYAYTRFTIGKADKGKKLKIQWAQHILAGYLAGNLVIEMFTNSASNYGGAYTAVPVAVGAVPAADGVLLTTFDSTTADYYELRVRRTGGTTAIVVSDALVGPGILASVPAVYTGHAWTPTGSWTSNVTYTGSYDRIGRHGRFKGSVLLSGVPSPNVPLDISLPSGLTLDTAAPGFANLAADYATDLGSGVAYDLSGIVPNLVRITYVGSVTPTTSGIRPIYYTTAGAGGNPVTIQNYIDANVPFVWASGDRFDFDFIAPIAEWAGDDGVFSTQTAVDYAFNSSTSDADDTTSFGYGQGGTQFIACTANRAKTVRFQTPIQPSDVIGLEISTDFGATWEPPSDVSAINLLKTQNGVSYGIGWSKGGASPNTDIIVTMAQYRDANSTYGAAGTVWGGVAANAQYLWRLVKSSNPLSIGHNLVNQNDSGLVASAGQLLGTNTSDNAASGHVGEFILVQTSNSVSTTATYFDAASFDFTGKTGDFDVWASVAYNRNSATLTSDLVAAGLSTTTGNSSSGLVAGFNYSLEDITAPWERRTAIVPICRVQNDGVNLSIDTIPLTGQVLYVKGYVDGFSAGNPSYNAKLSVRRAR